MRRMLVAMEAVNMVKNIPAAREMTSQSSCYGTCTREEEDNNRNNRNKDRWTIDSAF